MLSLGRDKSRVRPPAVAGLCYPEDARELRRAIDAYLEACPRGDAPRPPKALIVPHA